MNRARLCRVRVQRPGAPVGVYPEQSGRGAREQAVMVRSFQELPPGTVVDVVSPYAWEAGRVTRFMIVQAWRLNDSGKWEHYGQEETAIDGAPEEAGLVEFPA